MTPAPMPTDPDSLSAVHEVPDLQSPGLGRQGLRVNNPSTHTHTATTGVLATSSLILFLPTACYVIGFGRVRFQDYSLPHTLTAVASEHKGPKRPKLNVVAHVRGSFRTHVGDPTPIVPSYGAPGEGYSQTEQLTFLWIIFIMIVAGNCAVLVALLLSKNRKSRMNFFIMHLAIADLSVGLINVLTDIIWRTTVAFYADNITCKVVKYLQVIVTYSSTYVLVALSIDRYDAIAHPMNFSSGWRKARILVGSAWGLSAVFALPSVFINSQEEIKGMPQCWIDLQQWQWQLYITTVAVSLFFVPALIIAACYTVIVYTIWNKSKQMAYPKINNSSIAGDSKKSNVSKNKSTSSSNSSDMEVDRKRASSRGIIPRAKIKTVKMTLVIVFVFILCWSPYFVYDLLQVYGKIPDGQTTIAISTFIQSLAPLNSAANPLIYCLFSTHICGNFRRLAFCNWMSRKVRICFPLMHRSVSTNNSRASEYTTMTETMNSTIRHPVSMYRSPRSHTNQVNSTASQEQRRGVLFQETTVINTVHNSAV